MAFFNYAKKELSAKVVYYGPGLSGKTTNLEVIHKRMRPEQRGQLLLLDTQTDRTLFFDFLPLELGEIRGFKMRVHLYTVPGQVFYNATRKVVLKGVDGIVFVADSQKGKLASNIESFQNLVENLAEKGQRLQDLPYVVQYNKRDLADISPVEELDGHLNPHGVPHYEAEAIHEKGVIETLTTICKLVLKNLKETQEGTGKLTAMSPEALGMTAGAGPIQFGKARPVAMQPPATESPAHQPAASAAASVESAPAAVSSAPEAAALEEGAGSAAEAAPAPAAAPDEAGGPRPEPTPLRPPAVVAAWLPSSGHERWFLVRWLAWAWARLAAWWAWPGSRAGDGETATSVGSPPPGEPTADEPSSRAATAAAKEGEGTGASPSP